VGVNAAEGSGEAIAEQNVTEALAFGNIEIGSVDHKELRQGLNQ
jgi:hypothetical protein